MLFLFMLQKQKHSNMQKHSYLLTYTVHISPPHPLHHPLTHTQVTHYHNSHNMYIDFSGYQNTHIGYWNHI